MRNKESALTDPWKDLATGPGLGVPVAIGGTITPGSLLGAYRRGLFCQPRTAPEQIELNRSLYGPDVSAGDIPVLPCEGDPYSILWWSPSTRYVIPVAEVRLGRTSRRALRTRDWTTTVDRDFEGVIAACRGDREPRWITDELVAALRGLRDEGWIRTVEVWDGSRLVGGLFGCAVGGVFIMDSAFHAEPEAAKVAIADLARRVGANGIALLDTQVRTEYTVRMGSRELPRHDYLTHLAAGQRPGFVEPGIGHARDLVSRAEPQTGR